MVTLSSKSVMRALSVAAMATASLYAVMVLVAEPTGGLAANMDVDVRLAETISITCSGSGANVHINDYVPISASNTTPYDGEGSCNVQSNNDAGYVLKWNIDAGTGAAGSRTGTGHLNSFIPDGVAGGYLAYTIRPLQVTSESQATSLTPVAFATHSDMPSGASDIRWAGRVKRSSTSDYISGGSPDFGEDGDSSIRFASVSTGSAITIAKRTTPTSEAGDTETLQFRVIYGASNFSPATTYKARVVLTAVNN